MAYIIFWFNKYTGNICRENKGPLSLTFFNLVFFIVYVYFACMYGTVLCLCLLLTEVKKKDIAYPGTGVTDICEPPFGCWK